MPKKVFELAKELNLRPLQMVDTLKVKGFTVRNHMSVLSDDELSKISSLLKEDKEGNTAGKSKKKVRRKASASAKEPQKTKKKAPVIRRRISKKEEEISSLSAKKEEIKEEAPSGHRFTPVSSPKQEQKTQEGKEEKVPDKTSSPDADRPQSKKRLGGLASMMSEKKSGFSRSQTLNQTRADSEMKSYATLSSLGRPIYSQIKKKKTFHGVGGQTEITEVKQSKRVIQLHKGGTVKEISLKLGQKVKSLVNQVLELNLLVRPDDFIGVGLACEIAKLYGYRVEDISFKEEKIIDKEKITDEEREKLPLRDPVIAIMGHVDHGKTTLLDTIRKEKVAQGEAGGITQHIGAYCVKTKNGRLIFLDTPGHSAFASMRQRGADITDIVVLVVAADDGVMPQTQESLRFCRQANKPIIVAINKTDREQADAERIKKELSELEVVPEDWGGDTQFVPISALKGEGIEDLLEAIALQAEILDIRENPDKQASGVVIESKIEEGRGSMATVLVQSGTLKKGDNIVVGEAFGRARKLIDFQGKTIPQAGPSTPIQIQGLNQTPGPGDLLDVVKNEREAKKIARNRTDERKELESTPIKAKISLEDFFATNQSETCEQKKLNLIIRADVQGSYQAIKQSLESLGNPEVIVVIVGGGIGPISDSDINLAISAKGFVIGFNMRPITSARRLAEEKGVDIKTYSIIYELIGDVKLAMEGLLTPEFNEQYIGRAEVKDTFSTPKAGIIAGSEVVDGKIAVGCNIRLLREGKIVFDGKMSSLRRFKDDVKEVKNGLECGVGLFNFNDIKKGDLFEAYNLIESKRKLEDVKTTSPAKKKVIPEVNDQQTL